MPVGAFGASIPLQPSVAEKPKRVSTLVVLVFSPVGNLAEVGSLAQLGNMIKTRLDPICTL